MRRGRTVFAIVAVGASLGWVGFGSLQNSLVYYKTPSELVRDGQASIGERLRLGGLVVVGSVHPSAEGVRFLVTDGSTDIAVFDTGSIPELFSDRRGVVVEGTYGRDGVFHADTVLVRHDDDYRPPGLQPPSSPGPGVGD